MMDLDDLRFYESDNGSFLVIDAGARLDRDGRYAFVGQYPSLSICDCAFNQEGMIDIGGRTYVRGEAIPNLVGRVVRGSAELLPADGINEEVYGHEK